MLGAAAWLPISKVIEDWGCPYAGVLRAILTPIPTVWLFGRARRSVLFWEQ